MDCKDPASDRGLMHVYGDFIDRQRSDFELDIHRVKGERSVDSTTALCDKQRESLPVRVAESPTDPAMCVHT